ncbi:hypothetical protein DL764_000009 [Monosporascus ibericus]|uniref:Uncharacterized protein n=1 Tax=Monosporascus ibericus TaxID=155417 RepID=A0A4Q4TVB3_9PEZI|nr:hypothetical protein DL764_000009 [Monosporascus ibericus]
MPGGAALAATAHGNVIARPGKAARKRKAQATLIRYGTPRALCGTLARRTRRGGGFRGRIGSRRTLWFWLGLRYGVYRSGGSFGGGNGLRTRGANFANAGNRGALRYARCIPRKECNIGGRAVEFGSRHGELRVPQIDERKNALKLLARANVSVTTESMLIKVPVRLKGPLNCLSKLGHYRPWQFTGMGLFAIAYGLFSRLDENSTTAHWAGIQSVGVVGIGILMTTTIPAIQAPLPEADVAVAVGT